MNFSPKTKKLIYISCFQITGPAVAAPCQECQIWILLNSAYNHLCIQPPVFFDKKDSGKRIVIVLHRSFLVHKKWHSVKWSTLLYLVFLNRAWQSFCFLSSSRRMTQNLMRPCDFTSRDAERIAFCRLFVACKVGHGGLNGLLLFFGCGLTPNFCQKGACTIEKIRATYVFLQSLSITVYLKYVSGQNKLLTKFRLFRTLVTDKKT